MVIPLQLIQPLGQLAQNMDGGLGGLLCLFIGLSIISIVAIVWAIVDIVSNPRLSSNERIIWILVVLFLELLGVLIYAIFGRKRG